MRTSTTTMRHLYEATPADIIAEIQAATERYGRAHEVHVLGVHGPAVLSFGQGCDTLTLFINE